MGGFAGFDRSEFPGDAVMAWLKANTNLCWCGFYLAPAPSHPDQSWMNASDSALADWGLAPIYVGQETIGPGSHKVNAAHGKIDGDDACALMAKAGFDSPSIVYLDLENGPPFTAAQSQYVGAWCDAVVGGGYTAGIYCSFLFAAQVAALRPNAKIWAFHVRTVLQHHVAGKTFPNPDPTTSGFTGAHIWQLDDSALIPCAVAPGGQLLVDLDSADSADPSTP